MSCSLPILYSFRRCPYAMRARLAIYYAQQHVELREVSLKHKPTSLYTYSPKATVPVMAFNDGRVIDESLDIMLWALNKQDPDNWLENLDDQGELIKQNDFEFKQFLDKYKYADRHPELSELAHRDNCYFFLEELEQRLTKHPYLFSDRPRLADMALLPFIRQFAHVDLSWFERSAWTQVNKWLMNFKTSELFKSIMFKYPVWSEGDAVTLFPAHVNHR